MSSSSVLVCRITPVSGPCRPCQVEFSKHECRYLSPLALAEDALKRHLGPDVFLLVKNDSSYQDPWLFGRAARIAVSQRFGMNHGAQLAYGPFGLNTERHVSFITGLLRIEFSTDANPQMTIEQAADYCEVGLGGLDLRAWNAGRLRKTDDWSVYI